MSTTVPSFSESTVTAITTLARNAVSRSTVDLRTKWGGWLFLMVGRTGTTALTSGVVAIARRTLSNAAREAPAAYAFYASGQTVAAISTTCAASGSDAASTTLTVASTTSFVAGDLLLVENGSDRTASEWCRVARVTDSTHFLLDAPLQYAHNSTSHTVRNKADGYCVWLDGGATYEVVFDYGASTTGESVVIEAQVQIQDNVTTT